VGANLGAGTSTGGALVVAGSACRRIAPNAYLLITDVRAILQPRRTNLLFSLGGGITNRGGEAFDVPRLDEQADLAGIFGIRFRTRVTPSCSFRLGTEMPLHTPDGDGAYYQQRLQRDLIVTITVPYSLIGR